MKEPTKMIAVIAAVVTLVLFWMHTSAFAGNPDDVVVIAEREFPVDGITIDELRQVFLQRQKMLNDRIVSPIHAPKQSLLRRAFQHSAFGVQSKRAELIRLGKTGDAPAAVTEQAKPIDGLQKIPNGITYCFRKDFDPTRAKIIFEF